MPAARERCLTATLRRVTQAPAPSSAPRWKPPSSTRQNHTHKFVNTRGTAVGQRRVAPDRGLSVRRAGALVASSAESQSWRRKLPLAWPTASVSRERLPRPKPGGDLAEQIGQICFAPVPVVPSGQPANRASIAEEALRDESGPVRLPEEADEELRVAYRSFSFPLLWEPKITQFS